MEIRIAYRSDLIVWISFLAGFSYMKIVPRHAIPLCWKWAFKSKEYTSIFFGLWPASSHRVLAFAETTNLTDMFLHWRREQSVDWYGLNENSKVFNDQLLIKRADNVPRKVTKYPPEYIHLLWEWF